MKGKKLLALVLCLLMTVSLLPVSALADEDVYVVAGSANADLGAGGVSTPIFGTSWDVNSTANQMTLSGGVYTKTYTVTEAYTVEFKVVKNGTIWLPDNNIHLDLPANCNFTVTCDPNTNAVSYSVTMNYTSVYVTGNGSDASWLNNVNWNPAAVQMTQIQPDIWQAQIAVPAGNGYEMKFTVDGSWDRNFGGDFSGFGTETAAVMDGNNIAFNIDDATTLTVRLDLSNFNYQTQSGAKYTVSKPKTDFTISSCTYSTNGVNGSSEGGSIKVKSPVDYMGRVQTQPTGSEFTFTVTQYMGYELTLTALDESNNNVQMYPLDSGTLSKNKAYITYTYGLVIPASDVTVHAEFTGQRMYPITLNPSWYDENGTKHYPMTDAEKALVFSEISATVEGVPAEYAHAGDQITVTMAPNTGYFIKFSMASYSNYNNTLQQIGDYTFSFVMPNSVVNVSTEVGTGLDEGCYLQIADAEQPNWIPMIHRNLFTEDGSFVDNLWQTKQSLTAGQTLKVWYVDDPGGEPQLRDTRTVEASDLANGKATVYYVLNYGSLNTQIELCNLNGYYISLPDQYPEHMDSTGHWTRYNIRFPYETNESHRFVACGEGEAYYRLEYLKYGESIKVAKFTDGTVDQICAKTNVPDSFTSEYAEGIVFFRPSDTILILPTYALINGSPELCELGGPEYYLAADDTPTVRFTVTATASGYEVTGVTAEDANGDPVALTQGDGGVWSFTMPAADVTVTVTVTTEEQTYTITVNVVGVAGNIEYSLWAYPAGDDWYYYDEEQPYEITDSVVPVGKKLGIELTFKNGAQRVGCSIVYYDSEGSQTTYNDGVRPYDGTHGFTQTDDTMGEGAVTVTLTVDPVYIELFTSDPYDYRYIDLQATAPYETTIPDNPFTREGYVFTGWNTASDGSGTAYAPGDTVNLYTNIGLWAQWVKEGYFLVQIPADATNVSLTDTLYWLELARNESATFGEEYMLAGGIDIPLTEGDKLFVIRVQDGAVQVWDNVEETWGTEFSLSNYTYLVDANHEDEHAKVYFREQTPNPETHPFWQDFGGHLFIAIAREIDVTSQITDLGAHGAVTASPEMGVYTETIHLTVTPEAGYRLLGDPWVTIGTGSDEVVITSDGNGAYHFTMPDNAVKVHAIFCLEDGYYMNGTMNNDWDLASITPAMKFAPNTGVDGEYKLSWVFGAATDEFKVVHLVDGQIAVWYGTKKEGHKGDGNEEQAYNYRINDQTGARTVYFRPVWNDDWSGHIWIGEDVVPRAFLMESSASFNDSIKMNFYVDYSAAAGNMPEGVQAVLTCNGNTVKFPVANTPYVPGKGYKISYDLVAKQVEDVVNIKLVDANDQPFLFTSKKGTRDYTVNGKDLTLREYLDYMLILSDWNALGQAAKDYCYAAKHEFNYGAADSYSLSAAVGDVTLDQLEAYAPEKIGTMPAGVSTYQITAMFESDNSFRMYLKYDEANTEGNYTYAVDTVTSVDDPTLLKWSDTYEKHYLTFTGMYSNKLQEFHSITVSDENGSYTYNACVLTYARSVLKYETKPTLIALAQAAYLYNQAAINNFGE